MAADVRLVQCCSVQDVLDGVGHQDGADESPIRNGSYPGGGGGGQDIDAKRCEAKLRKGQHERNAQVACRPGDKHII